MKYIYEDGRLDLYREKGVMPFPQKRIEPDRWTHISIHFLLNEYNMVRFMMDGEILDEGQMYASPWRVRLVMGNSIGGDQPFDGWIDEVRIADCDTQGRPSRPASWRVLILKPGGPFSAMKVLPGG